MKCLLGIALAVLTAGAVFANDGGVAVVEVKSLKIIKQETATIAEFRGADAKEFMKILPAQFSAISPLVPNFDDNFKALVIGTKDRKGSISIVCANGEIDFSLGEVESYRPYKSGTRCTIAIDKGYRYGEGDEERFNADEMVLKK